MSLSKRSPGFLVAVRDADACLVQERWQFEVLSAAGRMRSQAPQTAHSSAGRVPVSDMRLMVVSEPHDSQESRTLELVSVIISIRLASAGAGPLGIPRLSSHGWSAASS